MTSIAPQALNSHFNAPDAKGSSNAVTSIKKCVFSISPSNL